MAIRPTHPNTAPTRNTPVPATSPEGTLNTLRSLAAGLLPSSATLLSSAKSIFDTFIRATNPDVAYMVNSMEVEHRIDEWVAQDPQNLENREGVKEMILRYLNEPGDTLHFNDLLTNDLLITSLPEIFSFEPFTSKLKTLSLIHCAIQSLPDSIGNLKNLQRLDLTGCPINSLPDSIGNLVNLKYLLLDFSHIRSLPDSIRKLVNLQKLFLGHSHIQSLPDFIDNLVNLKYLLLDFSHIQSLPNSIVNLPSHVFINLSGCHLSDTVLNRLREATAAPGYNGPDFSYYMGHAHNPEVIPSLEEALAKTYQNAKTDQEELPNLLSADTTFKNNLAMWLGRLQETADGTSANSEGFYKTILENLRLANSNADFRALFAVTIEGACDTCGDRVALSVLELGVQRRLIQCDKTDLKAFAELLKGSHAINLLEQVAREKIPSLPFFDEIEVYLGYPIKLKEALKLPIDINNMLFFSCSSLTDADLASAKDFVLSVLNNKEAVAKFLSEKEDWVLALKANFPKDFDEINSKQKAALEAALEADEPDYIAIEADYKKSLKELTLKALQTVSVHEKLKNLTLKPLEPS